MKTSVEVTGIREVTVRINKLTPEIQAKIGKALQVCGLVIQNKARELVLKGPKTGRVYNRNGRVHVASAPGEPPASDTGTLVRSILMDVDLQALTLKVAAGTMYAKYLEYGTRHMAPRPFMSTALKQTQQKVMAVLQGALK